VGSGDDSNIVGPVPDLPFRRSCRGLVVGGDRVLLARHRIRDGGTVWLRLAAGPRKAGNSMRRYPASCRGEWPGDHRRPCAAARVGLDGRFPSTQEYGYAELGWNVLSTLVASELATKTDVMQVIAEHAALGEQATDEGGPSDGPEGDP
jgi:hypothetical protein